jgi:hypothetical protein
MSTLNPKHPDCNCENEAETLYNMWNIMDLLKDNTSTGKSSCCTDEDVTITVKDRQVTIIYPDGTTFVYP